MLLLPSRIVVLHPLTSNRCHNTMPGPCGTACGVRSCPTRPHLANPGMCSQFSPCHFAHPAVPRPLLASPSTDMSSNSPWTGLSNGGLFAPNGRCVVELLRDLSRVRRDCAQSLARAHRILCPPSPHFAYSLPYLHYSELLFRYSCIFR